MMPTVIPIISTTTGIRIIPIIMLIIISTIRGTGRIMYHGTTSIRFPIILLTGIRAMDTTSLTGVGM